MTMLRLRYFIWSHRWTVFPAVYIIGMAIGYVIGPYFWDLVR